MRTQGFHPMMQSFSSDLGKSWSPPVKTGVDGVWPDLCLMQSGIVACAYGRPGCNIMFSLDGRCREWSHHTVIIPPFQNLGREFPFYHFSRKKAGKIERKGPV